jgi:cytidylate kinase
MSIIIAVDGPVAAGKGTLARKLAAHFGYAYLDTGSLYRACGLRALLEGADPADPDAAVQAARHITSGDLTAAALRDEATGQAASKVAAIPAVRATLLDWQRDYAANPPGGEPGAVLDGRDIGTVVCPDATVKLYVTASAAVRAHRRWLELTGKGQNVTEAQVLADLEERDARDSARAVAPLKPADDAVLLDTSNLAIEAAFEKARAIIAGRLRA